MKLRCQEKGCDRQAGVVFSFRYKGNERGEPPANVWAPLGRDWPRVGPTEHRRGFVCACLSHGPSVLPFAQESSESGVVAAYRVMPCRSCKGDGEGEERRLEVDDIIAFTNECEVCEGTGAINWVQVET